MTVNLVLERRREESPVPLAWGPSVSQCIVSRITFKEDIDTWVYENKSLYIYICIRKKCAKYCDGKHRVLFHFNVKHISNSSTVRKMINEEYFGPGGVH